MTDPTTRDPAASLARCIELAAKATPGVVVARKRGDGSVYLSIGDPRKGPHAQGDVYLPYDDVLALEVALTFIRDAAPALLAEVEAAKDDAARWRFYRASKQTQYMLDVDSAEAADAAADAAILAHHGARTGESNG